MSSEQQVVENLSTHPHVRRNPLADVWVLVSPHRMRRPWQGEKGGGSDGRKAAQDVAGASVGDNLNALAPGGVRAGEIVTPDYVSTYVFDNDFPALYDRIDQPDFSSDDDLFAYRSVRGDCKVMCFHPSSSVALGDMSQNEICEVLKEWRRLYEDLGKRFDWVQVFENKGAMVGCSNPHPHCQIWSCDRLPTIIQTKHRTQREYFQKHKKVWFLSSLKLEMSPTVAQVMLIDYLERELASGERIICSNEDWVLLVPFWAYWPFETMLLPRRHRERFGDLTPDEIASLASFMKTYLKKFDSLFDCSFPYCMGWHGAPTGSFTGSDVSFWQLHALYLPPLLRSSSVKKFMAGFELLAECQRDLTPERAAAMLREAAG